MDTLKDICVYLISNGTGMSSPSKNGNLKLQKLLYYAESVSLLKYNEKLFSEDIEAWIEGPAVRAAYVSYRYYGLWNETVNNVSNKVKSILDFIIYAFDNYDTNELVSMTHDESPWKQYENEVGSNQSITIDSEDIINYQQENSNLLEMFNNFENQKKMTIGNVTFTYNPKETTLNDEDIEIIKQDFHEETGEFYIYKEDGELVIY